MKNTLNSMKHWLRLMTLLLVSALAQANAPSAGLHIQANELAQWLQSDQPPVVIDVRPSNDFSSGHVPTALNVWRPDYGAPRGTYSYNGMRADANRFYQLLSRLGVETDSNLVIYTGDGLHDAYRFAWLSEMYGHPQAQVWVLDGGLSAWTGSNFSLSTDATTATASLYTPSQSVNEQRLAYLGDLVAAQQDPQVVILDSRTLEEYLGIALYAGATRRGHIPGAVHINYTENFDAEGVKDLDSLRALYTSKGITADKTILVYCQSGVRSAMTTKILSEMLGYPDVRNYDGSWIEWSHSDQSVVSIFLYLVTGLLLLAIAVLLGLGIRAQRAGRSGQLKKWSLLPTAILAIFLLWYFNLLALISMDGVQELQAWIQSFGWLGPLVFVLLFALAAVFFLPGAPFAIVAAIAFGPIMGTVWASIGSTLGACLAFLVARYLVRDYAASLINKNPKLQAIDNGVERHGWRMLMITRFVPVFPFNVQNYIYGITKIRFVTYALLSWLFMLPGTLAYVFITGAAVSGASLGVIMIYFSIGAIVLVGLSFVPKLLKKKSAAADLL